LVFFRAPHGALFHFKIAFEPSAFSLIPFALGFKPTKRNFAGYHVYERENRLGYIFSFPNAQFEFDKKSCSMRYLHPDRSTNGRKAGEGIQCGDRLSGFYSASHSWNTWLQVVETESLILIDYFPVL
jgi:hypothetical protein